jgi:cyclophilin family peptidyl-prolyl cis-trans isomerase
MFLIKLKGNQMKFITVLIVLVLGIILLTGCTQNPRVVIVTNLGEIELELFADKTPGHAANFVKLVNEGFYSGTTFHRVVKNFVIQGGDPNSKDMDPNNDGTGGPGYTLPAEIKLPHMKGSLAAARLPDQMNPQKQSSGSQFYICLQDLPQLDAAGYTVFGKVVNGMETVEKIGRINTDQREHPLRRIVMERVYIK